MTGSLKLANGTFSAPSIAFNTAQSTGLYKTTNGFGIAINGAQVAEFTAGGLTKGSRYIGEMFPWTGSTAPARCVLPYGQTLDRTVYADLWTFAQAEIAAGNTFYNNGNGSTTFGIGDLRGRVVASPDNMGGTDASRLTGSNLSSRTVLGTGGGEGAHALSASEIANINSTTGGPIGVSVTSNSPSIVQGAPATAFLAAGGNAVTVLNSAGPSSSSITSSGATSTINSTSTNTGGTTGVGHNNMQPTILLDYALYAGA